MTFVLRFLQISMHAGMLCALDIFRVIPKYMNWNRNVALKPKRGGIEWVELLEKLKSQARN